MKNSVLTKLFWLIIIVLWAFGTVSANPDKEVQLRLYEGFRKPVKMTSRVTTSTFLVPMFQGSLQLDSENTEEKDEIKKIFNLTNLEKIASARWVWSREEPAFQFQLMVINGHEFYIYLKPAKEKDAFQMEVVEKTGAKKIKIFESDFMLPQSKSTVFGFEDSASKPFFLAFDRKKDSNIYVKLKIPHISRENRPKLIRLEKPVYPEEALQKKVSGEVILEATTDVYGRVVNVVVQQGHKLLDDAAVNAVKQWVYEPYIIDGKPKPVRFTVSVRFSLFKKEKPKQ